MWILAPQSLGSTQTSALQIAIVPLPTGAALAITATVSGLDFGMGRDPQAPVHGVSHDEAEDFARLRGFRLPTSTEWSWLADIGCFVPRFWEWTSTPQDGGFAVLGGAWRNRHGSGPDAANRSWENSPAPDLGFRCVRTLPRADSIDLLETGCQFCGGTGKSLISQSSFALTLDDSVFVEGIPHTCACGAVGVSTPIPMDAQDAVAELIFDGLKLTGVANIESASATARSLKAIGYESIFDRTHSATWIRRRG
jgi:hypothetical protein